MSSYSYQPINVGAADQIRVLTLLPGTDTEDIRCLLTVFDLNKIADNKSYETLSYTWGEAVSDKYIILHGDTGGARFDIGLNLYHALHAFRHAENVRELWIDAICINQEDNDEKARQIPLMRRIYEGSIQTLVWLGKSTSESRPAMNLARALHNAWVNCGGNVPKIGTFNSNELKQHGLPSLFSTNYVKLLTMLEQPWFTRAWIVQEVTVSKKSVVFWGSETIEWQHLVLGIDFALRAQLPFALHPAVNRFVPIAEEAANYRASSCRLLSALLRHRPCAATNPVDKVYAFLGLTERGAGNYVPIKVDYKQDLATCYTNVAREICAHDQSLDILSVAATPFPSLVDGLPTWVPDWSPAMGAALRQTFNGETTSLANAEGSGKRRSPQFCAARQTPYVRKGSTEENCLHVEGHLFDTITRVEARPETVHMPSGSVKEPAKLATEIGKTVSSVFTSKSILMQWEESIGLPELRPHSVRYPTGEGLVDAFWQTLMVGNIAAHEDKNQIREEYLAWSRLQRPAPALNRFKLGYLQTAVSAVKSLAASAIMQDAPTQFQKRVQDIIFRRFVRTSRGYMGVCSGDVQTGDKIWLCKGSKVPIVLRSAGENHRWTFVGDVYVHGIMYGEGFREDDCHEIMLC